MYENTDSKAPELLIQQVWGGVRECLFLTSSQVDADATDLGPHLENCWSFLEGMDKLTCHVGKLRTEGQQTAVFKDLLADPLEVVWDGEADKWTTDLSISFLLPTPLGNREAYG